MEAVKRIDVLFAIEREINGRTVDQKPSQILVASLGYAA
jgi:hypothetical protein